LQDLSYNVIEEISGLERLTKLTDLTLHHNLISELDGLDYQRNLETLSLGDNRLEALEDDTILYLRQFEKLKVCGHVVATNGKGGKKKERKKKRKK
jgi:Leucine-rich repeat (LRR) protein